jgi:AraC-like DNA-binding protein
VKSNFLGPFLLWLQSRERPVEDWLAQVQLGLDVIGSRDCHVPHGAYCELLELAERDTPSEPALGLAFAQSTDRMYAFMEALWQNCSNLEAVLDTWRYYDKLVDPRMAFTLVEQDGTIAIRQTSTGYDLAQERVSNEFLIGWLLMQVRMLTGVRVVATEVRFAHPMPADTSAYVNVFGTANLHFGQTENRIVFDDQVRSLPIALADPRVYDALISCVADPVTEAPPRPLLERLHEAIKRRLVAGAPLHIDEIAKGLGVSVRTLQRRIAEAGSTFLHEVENVREAAAKEYVCQGKLSLGEVAKRLGYAHTSAFSRAFKRWTGRTPSDFRDHPHEDTTPPPLQSDITELKQAV